LTSESTAAGRGIAGPRAEGPEGARRQAATHALRRWRGAGRCAGRGGRCFAPTTLRCSPRGRAAKLAALAARAPLGHSPRVRSTKRAARADPGAALLGAADIAPAPPRATAAGRASPPGASPLPAPRRAARRYPDPLPPAALETAGVFGATVETFAASTATASAKARAARRRHACAQPRSAAVPARARSALRTSDSPRLFERSSRSERSEFRGGAGIPSIAGHPRAAGASAGAPAASGPRLCPRHPAGANIAAPNIRPARRATRCDVSWSH